MFLPSSARLQPADFFFEHAPGYLRVGMMYELPALEQVSELPVTNARPRGHCVLLGQRFVFATYREHPPSCRYLH